MIFYNIVKNYLTKVLIIAFLLTINFELNGAATSVNIDTGLYEIDTNKDEKYSISEIQAYITSLGGKERLFLIGGYQFAAVIYAIKLLLGLS